LIHVLVVDDSSVVRSVLTEMIDSQPDMRVVGTAPDPYVAREKIKALNPDVLTLDIEMPRMSGLDFLEKLMRLRPMPVIMVSTLTERNSDETLRALQLGAVDFIAKPALGVKSGLTEQADDLAEKIRAAAGAKIRRLSSGPIEERRSADAVLPLVLRPAVSEETLIAIGASTGGTEAIREVLMGMPGDSPGILITQHMPAGFTKSFAGRLHDSCALTVTEAREGERIVPGHAYVAPGDAHLMAARNGSRYVVKLSDGPAVSRHRPSVDVMFRSVANAAGHNALGILLTGMGQDGAQGMEELRCARAFTLAQNEETCVVFGMPRAAIERGAVDAIVPLDQVAATLIRRLSAPAKAARAR
jgi:two-component system chemotaxis response regulator CheB